MDTRRIYSVSGTSGSGIKNAPGSASSSGLCLICHKSSDNHSLCTLFQSPVISQEINVYFILRHVLELPSQQLELYLRLCPYPREWVRICSVCNDNLVANCGRIFLELTEVQKKFKAARMKIVRAMQLSFVNDVRKDLQEGEEFIFDIHKETRRFVKLHQYDDSNAGEESVLVGDIIATEKYIQEIRQTEQKTSESNIKIEVEDELTFSPIHDDTGNNHGDGWKEEEQDSLLNWAAGQKTNDDYIEDASGISFNSFNDAINADNQLEETVMAGNFSASPNVLVGTHVNEEGFTTSVLGMETSKTSFPVETDLITQIHQDKKFQCEYCEKDFFYRKTLFRHLRLKHPEKADEVKKRKEQSKLSNLYSADKLIKSNALKCVICQAPFSSHLNRIEHLLRIHGKYGCEQCEKSFNYKKTLCRHIRLKHCRTDNNTNNVSKVSTRPRPRIPTVLVESDSNRSTEQIAHATQLDPPKPDQNAQKFCCKHCGKEFHYKKTLCRHIRLKHDLHDVNQAKMTAKTSSKSSQKQEAHKLPSFFVPEADWSCPDCRVTFLTNLELVEHVSKAHQKFHCEHCGKDFFHRKTLRRHIRWKHEAKEATYCCPFEGCGKSFHDKWSMDSHRKYHFPPKYKCDICNRKFHVERDFNRHIKHHHENTGDNNTVVERSFLCEMCPATFSWKAQLGRHMKAKHKLAEAGTEGVGEESKDFACSICGIIKPNKETLTRHVEMVHERKFEICCDLCGKILMTAKNLRNHQIHVHGMGLQNNSYKKQSKIPCTVEGCDRSFGTDALLKKHLSMHDKGPVFPCELCGKILFSARNLRSHTTALHTNRMAKPYKCSECGRGFALRNYLVSHKKLHKRQRGDKFDSRLVFFSQNNKMEDPLAQV